MSNGEKKRVIARTAARGHAGKRQPARREIAFSQTGRISAPEAERLGIHPDWPTWPRGADMTGTWEWLLQQVECGAFPDMPCRWSDHVGAGRSPVYWLDLEARTRHVVVGYGRLVLTHPITAHAGARGRAH